LGFFYAKLFDEWISFWEFLQSNFLTFVYIKFQKLNLLKEDKINYLNIGLMFLTAGAAYFFSIETFLLA